MPLFRFVGAINLVSVLLVLVVFGGAAHLARRSLPRFLVFLRDELVLVAFTGSTLAALPPLSEKLERLGCPRRLTDIVLPFSYSLNLAETHLYIAVALVFLAKLLNVAPADTVAMLAAIDRTMKCRLLTNVIGHGLTSSFLTVKANLLSAVRASADSVTSLAPPLAMTLRNSSAR